MTGPTPQFVLRMTESQPRLYAYIRAMVPQLEEAREILQETNVALLKKAEEYRSEQNFEAWACRVAYFEILAHRRDLARDRHVFNDQLLEKISTHAEHASTRGDTRLDLLEVCIEKLAADQRELISDRYFADASLEELSQKRGASATALSTRLARIRRQLLECVERQLRTEGR